MTNNRRSDDEHKSREGQPPVSPTTPETHSPHRIPRHERKSAAGETQPLPVKRAEPQPPAPSQRPSRYERYGRAEEWKPIEHETNAQPIAGIPDGLSKTGQEKSQHTPESAAATTHSHHEQLPSPTRHEAHKPSASREKSLVKRFRTAIIFMILGIVLLGIGLKLLPSGSQTPTSIFDQITVRSLVPISVIDYGVTQATPDIAEIKITLINSITPSEAAAFKEPSPISEYVAVLLPAGVHFSTCPNTGCVYSAEDEVSTWAKPIVLKVVPASNSQPLELRAIVYFFVKAHDFGETYDNVNASVTLPQVTYDGSGSAPTLAVNYYIPSAINYDWSSYQPEFLNNVRAVWAEPVTNTTNSSDEVQSKVVTGTDYTNQQRNTLYTFVAGVVIGLAGSALLVAVQEALHADDGTARRTKHSKTRKPDPSATNP